MGIYIDKGNKVFRQIRNSEYIDKSGLISIVNRTLFTEQQFTCVTRCRRFGKSMAAKMLAAYYDRSCDSRNLFTDLQIASDPTFEEHLNKYPVIYLDLSGFAGKMDRPDFVQIMDAKLKADITAAFPSVEVRDDEDLMDSLLRIHAATGDTFIFIIDEWDAVLRELSLKTELKGGSAIQKEAFVNWLRRMFKDALGMEVFAGVYMTGILPIKKYDTQSAMNNFREYTMITPRKMAPFFGFTKEEVKTLATKHQMGFDELEKWYDGYEIGDLSSMFNPNSVMQAIDNGRCESFWSSTGAFDSVATYINMNYEGLRDDVISMLAGERCTVDPTGFQNDLADVRNKDDVFTVLIHLGYLSYDWRDGTCYIPNQEVAGEMVNAVKANNWKEVVNALQQSRQLLDATLRGDAQLVAHLVQEAHLANASLIKYSDENSMSCVLAIAYYYAHVDYIFHREYQTGTGFADLVMIPRKNVSKPAIIVELKYNDTTDTAIDQIHQRHYTDKIAEYSGNILLVAISYDRKKKEHQCQIESWHR